MTQLSAEMAASTDLCTCTAETAFADSLPEPTCSRMSSSSSWAVLVAGETYSVMRPDLKKTREGKYLGGHTSLQNIGKVYHSLLEFLLPERIIVIAQLEETLQWLRLAANSEEDCKRMAGKSELLDFMRGKLLDTYRDCADLLNNGGADYDGEDVNPATLLHVLTGGRIGHVETNGRKVVPFDA